MKTRMIGASCLRKLRVHLVLGAEHHDGNFGRVVCDLTQIRRFVWWILFSGLHLRRSKIYRAASKHFLIFLVISEYIYLFPCG